MKAAIWSYSHNRQDFNKVLQFTAGRAALEDLFMHSGADNANMLLLWIKSNSAHYLFHLKWTVLVGELFRLTLLK